MISLNALAAACLVMTAGPATAQNPPTVVNYSLPQTIEAALASSAEIQTATRDVQIDRKQADIEFARLRPGVRFDGQATKADDKSRVSIAGSAPIVIAEDHTEVLSASVALDLDLLGQIRAAASQAKLQSLADEFTLAAIRNQRILTAKSIYYNLLRAERPELPVVILTTFQTDETLTEALQAGARGFLLKDAAPADLPVRLWADPVRGLCARSFRFAARLASDLKWGQRRLQCLHGQIGRVLLCQWQPAQHLHQHSRRQHARLFHTLTLHPSTLPTRRRSGI